MGLEKETIHLFSRNSKEIIRIFYYSKTNAETGGECYYYYRNSGGKKKREKKKTGTNEQRTTLVLRVRSENW